MEAGSDTCGCSWLDIFIHFDALGWEQHGAEYHTDPAASKSASSRKTKAKVRREAVRRKKKCKSSCFEQQTRSPGRGARRWSKQGRSKGTVDGRQTMCWAAAAAGRAAAAARKADRCKGTLNGRMKVQGKPKGTTALVLAVQVRSLWSPKLTLPFLVRLRHTSTSLRAVHRKAEEQKLRIQIQSQAHARANHS